MGNFARSLGLARVTPVVGGYGFGSPHSLAGAIPVISSDPWIARRGAQHGRRSELDSSPLESDLRIRGLLSNVP